MRFNSILFASMAFVLLALCGTAFAIPLNCSGSAQTLSAAGMTYTLNDTCAVNSATAINITAANIMLDCAGFSIIGSNTSNTYGIYTNQISTTVKNCNISSFQTGVYFVGATNGLVQNTSVIASIISTPARGIYLYSGSNNNQIINCSASVVGNYGISFFVESSSNNQITSSTGISPSYEGIQLSSANNITVSNCFIGGKDAAGALIVYSNSNNNTIANSTINGNAGAYAATLQGGSNTGNRFINNTILNATTLLYLDAGAGSNTFYWNNFSNAANNPTTYVNDLNGSNFYNITISGHGEGNIWGNVMNGSVYIYGTTLSGYGHGLFIGTNGSWPYNSSISGGMVSEAIDYAPLTPNNVSAPSGCACGHSFTAGETCTLTSNLTNSSTCFTVSAPNVTINCNGLSITGNNSTGTIGILSNQSTTTIKNCQISNFSTGIYFNGATNGTIRNSTVSTSTASDSNMNGNGIYFANNANYNTIANVTSTSASRDAIRLVSSSYNTISNSVSTAGSYAISIYSSSIFNMISNTNATASGTYAIILNWDSSYNTIAGSIANANSSAIALYSSNNTIANSTANASGSYAIDFSSSNSTIANSTFASAGGDIHFSQPSASGCANNFTNVNGSGGKPIIYYGNAPAAISGMSASTIILCNATGSSITSSNVTNGGIQAFYTSGSNFTGINATSVSSSIDAIRLSSSSNNAIANSIATAPYYAINLESSSNNTIVNLTATAATDYAIYLTGSSSNSITNTTATAIHYTCYLASSSNNTIANSAATATNAFAIYLTGSDNNTITNTNATANNSAIYLTSSFNNTLANNTVTSNDTDIYVKGQATSSGNCSGGGICEFDTEEFMCELDAEMFGCNWTSGSTSYPAGNNNFTNNMVTGGTYGFYVSNITNNIFVGNAITNNSLDGVFLDFGASANTFYWNNFTATSGLYINDTNGSNFYNTSMGGHGEGNIYANVMNGSVSITGTANSSGFPSLYVGSGGSGYPYSNSTSNGMVSSGVADYAPLTPNAAPAPTPAPAPSAGGGSPSTPATLASSFDCTSGSLNITATSSGSPRAGIRISLTESGTALNRLFATTDSSGIARFTITTSGSYSAESSGAYYGSLPSTDFDLCGQPQPAQNATPPAQNTTPPTQNNTPPANPPVNPVQPGTNGQNGNGGTQNGTNYGANGSQSGQNGQGIGNNNAISSGTQQLQQAVTEAAKPENAMPIASVFVIGGGIIIVLVALAGYLFFIRKKKKGI